MQEKERKTRGSGIARLWIVVDVAVWSRVIRQSEDIVHGSVVKKRKTDEKIDGELTFPGLVLGICILLNIQVGGNLLLSIIVIFTKISYSHRQTSY